MRVKTSVTLDEETITALDEEAGDATNRSRLIERAILNFLEHRRRAKRDARDRAILDRDADALNAEMADVLDYQVKL